MLHLLFLPRNHALIDEGAKDHARTLADLEQFLLFEQNGHWGFGTVDGDDNEMSLSTAALLSCGSALFKGVWSLRPRPHPRTQ